MEGNNKILPSHWLLKKLGDVCHTTSGGTPSRKNSTYYTGNIPWVKSGELNHNVIRDTEEHISEEAVKNSSAKIFPEGTLLIALYGATIGKLAILGIPATTNQAVCGIFKNEIFETKFLFNYLFHKKQKLIEQGAGGAQPNISQTILKKLPVPLSPLPEQRAIVAKIEQLFSELNNGIANLKAAKDKLEIYRQAVLKKAFEGDWETTTIGEQYEFLGGGTPSKTNPNYWNGNIPWCSVKDVKGDFLFETKDYITELGLNESSTKVAEVDQVILITRISPGKSIITKIRTAINQDLKIVFPKSDYHSKFTNYLFKSIERECIKRSSGTTVLGINLNSLKEIRIPDIPIEYQKSIIDFIESRLSVCDNILANIEEGLEKSEALRQSILKQAFEGKLLSEEELEVCRKEPDWEPAEQLLARIKNGNETSVKKKKAPAKQAPKKKIHHVEYYKRTLLAAEIVWQLHRQPTLGHLKLQKLIYLCQESGNMQLPTNFLQQAAGPYDPQMARSIDKQLKTKKWFTYRKNELLKYEPLEKAGGHQTDFEKYYAKDINNIQKVIELFRTAKSNQIEIVATLYACWKKIILEKAIFSENLLIKRFYEWSEEKSKYPESRVKKAAEWMQKIGIVPVKAEKRTIDE